MPTPRPAAARRLVAATLVLLLPMTAVSVSVARPDDARVGHADPTAAGAAAVPGFGTGQLLAAIGVDAGDTDPTPGRSPVPGLVEHVDPSCSGTGTDGRRVQVVYAREESQPSRLDEVAPVLRYAVAVVDDVFAVSAARDGADRRVRWVHDGTGPACAPVIDEVVVPDGLLEDAPGHPGFQLVQRHLSRSGLDSPDRKYLVFHEGKARCGTAQIEVDDSPGLRNLSNIRSGIAEVTLPCWLAPHLSIAAHELAHLLGAVMPSAPNADDSFHCADGPDLMCYSDGPGVDGVSCGDEGRHLLDCGADDYFHANPDAGSYLGEHWNVAFSDYLDRSSTPPPTQPTRVRVLHAGRGAVVFALTSRGDRLSGVAVTVTERRPAGHRSPAPVETLTDARGRVRVERHFAFPARYTATFDGTTTRRPATASTRWLPVRTRLVDNGRWGRVLESHPHGGPVSGAWVRLERRTDSGWVRVARGRTDRWGQVDVPAQPSGDYRWVFAGTPRYLPTTGSGPRP